MKMYHLTITESSEPSAIFVTADGVDSRLGALEDQDHGAAGSLGGKHSRRGPEAPILVRADDKRVVLVEGLHRLESCKALGETSVSTYLVEARRH